VEECLALAGDRIAARGVRVARDLADDVGEVRLDARELRKALLNLLLNGVDAMDEGGTLTVRTEVPGNDRVAIVIEDTGAGMDEETLARMFDLFFTTKPNGTGLGMAIAKSVVELHRGRLEVESAPGRGTRVRVELPAA
jgi:two-component system sensor histidine kinase AtoS